MDSREAVLLALLLVALIVLGGGAGVLFVAQRRQSRAELERAMAAERGALEMARRTELAATAAAQLAPPLRLLELVRARRDEHLREHPDCDHELLRRAGDLAWLLGDSEQAQAAWREGAQDVRGRATCRARLEALAAGRDPLGE
jgi:hypothetical protein